MGFREYFSTNESIYSEDTTIFELFVHNKKIDGNKVTLELSGVENLVGSFYIDSFEELETLEERLEYGVKVRVKGKLIKPSNNTIPKNFNYKEYLKYKGIYYTLDIEEIDVIDDKVNFIYILKNLINKRINKIDKTGYMKAFILGDKSLIDSDTYANYQKNGITHLFALSGMHVGLLSGIILILLKKLNDKLKYFILDTILIIYGYIVGFPSSIKRCILFFVVNSLNKIFKINLSTFKVLLLVIFILVVYDFKIIFDTGFRYSIATVLGITISSDYIADESRLKSSFKLSLVAFLFSLPISLSIFYEINLLSIFYNIVYVPFVSLIVYPLSLLTFVIPFFNSAFELVIKVLELSSDFFSKLNFFNLYMDFNLLEIVIFYFTLIMIFYKKLKILFIFLIFIIVFDLLIPYLDNNGYVYFFDVGQGDSSLIVSPNRKDVVLIDTGGVVEYKQEEWKDKKEYLVSDGVVSFLKSQGIKKIDLLILSHADADHAKEVENIYQKIKVKNLKINDGNIGKYEQIALELIDSYNYETKGMILKYLNYKEYKDENADSVLTYMKIYNTQILSFGDATKEAENDVVSKYNLNDVDILKLSHHGSKTSSSEYFLSKIKPKIGVISSGRNNRFNHPSRETIDTLNKLNIFYLNTQTSGTVEFVIKKNSVTYNEYKP